MTNDRSALGSLDQLARRVPARPRWEDLPVSTGTRGQLKAAAERARAHSDGRGWGRWWRRVRRHAGVTILFNGPDQTAKEPAAAAMARSLDQDLYRIDLSATVSKWIGETEKNLRRVFAEAERAGAVLFFDEADALFGKRTEVKDAHDRYANLETAIGQSSGVTIVSVNLDPTTAHALPARRWPIIEFADVDDD